MDELLHYQAEAAISLVAEGHCPICKVGLLTSSQVAPFHGCSKSCSVEGSPLR